MKVDVQYAETHFADLVSAATRGEVVEIDIPPAVSLLLTRTTPPKPAGRRRDLLGAWEGKIVLPTDEEWAAMDREIEDEMVNAPLISTGDDETAS